MDPAQVAQALASLSATERALAVDLVELDANPTYKLLSGAPLGPVTAKAVGAAINSAPQLWLDWTALRDRLRDLQSRSPDAIAPHDLQQAHDAAAALAPRLGELKVAIERVDAQWRRLVPHLDRARALLDDLGAADGDALAHAEPAIDAVRKQIDRIEDRLGSDPLGVADRDLDTLDAATGIARDRVRQLEAGRATLDRDRARAITSISTLQALAREAADAAAASRAKIRDPEGLVDVPAIDEASLTALQHAALDTSHSWILQRHALDRFLAQADRFEALLASAAEANRQPLDTRNELRGLLTAYRAKAAAIGLAENSDVGLLLRETQDQLHTAPCDLAKARSLLDRIAKALSRKGGKS